MHGSAITPALLLQAYATGLFPMAESRADPSLYWVSPDLRGIFPLDGFHVPKRLARTVRSDKFQITADACFTKVMTECAAPRPDSEESWINDQILSLYAELHRMGHAHSIEAWRDGELVGGLYGVHLRGAFFGESMFSRATDASKVALCHLVARLKLGGFSLLDTQFLTAHLASLGAIEISRDAYLERLADALIIDATWPLSYCPESSGNSGGASSIPSLGDSGTALAAGGFTGAVVMHLITQTS